MSRDGWAALPRGAKGLSAVCDCGISWSYSLTNFGCMSGLRHFKVFPEWVSLECFMTVSNQNTEGSSSICILDFPLCYRNSHMLFYWHENISEMRLHLTNNDDMWHRLLCILRQWFCSWFAVDCYSCCGFCVCSMVCYALLNVSF